VTSITPSPRRSMRSIRLRIPKFTRALPTGAAGGGGGNDKVAEIPQKAVRFSTSD